MGSIKITCAFCGKDFSRSKKRFNEAQKLGWKSYCSSTCLSNDRIKRLLITCENCGKKFERQPYKTSHRHHFCSSSCAAITNNKKRFEGKIRFKLCVRCGKKFRESKGNLKYCSIRCKLKTNPESTHRKLIKTLQERADELQRTPTRREIKESTTCRNFFGSWNKAIAAAGLQPNRSHSQRMYRRSGTIALDGHVCDSVSEALIDNWFTKNNIAHERNVLYPTTKHRADWVIIAKNNKIFVEYFGLANDSPRYDITVKEKQKLCRNLNLRLVEIYPQDLYPYKNFPAELRAKFRSLI